MRAILAGIETEYGLYVEGSGAEDQVDLARDLVRLFPGPCWDGWDYSYEHPRADLRGFQVSRLAIDPDDAQFDVGRPQRAAKSVASDRVLANGARLYNDHGHPEYATPECFGLQELARHDLAGSLAVKKAAKQLQARLGKTVSVYRNNTDYHGASYGTHESYLTPRSIEFAALYSAVVPMLIARQIVTGAGKAGSEVPPAVRFQMSQRSDFFSECASVDTLYRRPIFNTRDEPHADPDQWVRLHIICGDANMTPSSIVRKVGLVKIAILLCEANQAPNFKIDDEVRAFRDVGRDLSFACPIRLKDSNWTTAIQVIDAYLSAAEKLIDLDEEMTDVIVETRSIMEGLPDSVLDESKIDWATKRKMFRTVPEIDRLPLAALQAYDLEYHNVDREDGLYFALEAMEQAESWPAESELELLLVNPPAGTRAVARSAAVRNFAAELSGVSWGALAFSVDGSKSEVYLAPDRTYDGHLANIQDVSLFIQEMRQSE